MLYWIFSHLLYFNRYIWRFVKKTWSRNLISFIAVENNAIKTKYINAKIDNAQKNSKCGDRDEIVN